MALVSVQIVMRGWPCGGGSSNMSGFYEPIRKQTNRLFGATPKEQIAVSSVAAGALSGVIGGTCEPHPVYPSPLNNMF
jgi:hypothetical protein